VSEYADSMIFTNGPLAHDQPSQFSSRQTARLYFRKANHSLGANLTCQVPTSLTLAMGLGLNRLAWDATNCLPALLLSSNVIFSTAFSSAGALKIEHYLNATASAPQ